MAGAALGSAFLGAAVSLGTTLYNNEKGFSSRHEQNYDSQVALTQQLVEGFTKAHRDGDIDDEDHETFIRLRDEAIETLEDYSKNILDYKRVSAYNVPRRVGKKKKVRTSKQKLRQKNEKLQSHYCSSLSSHGSDASSIAAQSGSPPGSALGNERIRDWTHEVRSSRSLTSLVGEHSPEGEVARGHMSEDEVLWRHPRPMAWCTRKRKSTRTRQRESSPEPNLQDWLESASHPEDARPWLNSPHLFLQRAKKECDRDLQYIIQCITAFFESVVQFTEHQDNDGDTDHHLFVISGIATHVCELSYIQLITTPVNCLVPIIQRLQDVGKIWGKHPEWPGRGWYIEVLLSVAGLNCTLEWWNAEEHFWNSQPLTFVTSSLEDAPSWLDDHDLVVLANQRERDADSTASSLPTSIKDFNVVKPISKGATGSVFLVKEKTSGDLYAIKAIKKTNMMAKNQVTKLKAKGIILVKQERSPCVAKFCFMSQNTEHLYLVMEYLNGGDCAALVKSLGCLPEEWAKSYIAEIVLGLEYLHQRGIVHRDLKPDNLLIDSHGHVKLTDFGLSKFGLLRRRVNDVVLPMTKRRRKFVGTPDYFAPEAVLGLSSDTCSSAIDWWALGVIAYEFLYGVPPFHADTPEGIFENILLAHVEWREDKFSVEASTLMKNLLTQDSHKRLGYGGAEEVKAHLFFAGIEWDKVATVPRPLQRGTVSQPSIAPTFTEPLSITSNMVNHNLAPHLSSPTSLSFQSITSRHSASSLPSPSSPPSSYSPPPYPPQRQSKNSHYRNVRFIGEDHDITDRNKVGSTFPWEEPRPIPGRVFSDSSPSLILSPGSQSQTSTSTPEMRGLAGPSHILPLIPPLRGLSLGSPASYYGPLPPVDEQVLLPPVRRGGRVWDPAREVDLFKKGSEEVLARFLKMGSFDDDIDYNTPALLSPPAPLEGNYVQQSGSVQPHDYRRRRGYWNRRGDHLTDSGYIVRAPPDKLYPSELRNYPAEDEGYEGHDGTVTAFVPRPELPKSLPRNGMPAELSYEHFVNYIHFPSVLPGITDITSTTKIH